MTDLDKPLHESFLVFTFNDSVILVSILNSTFIVAFSKLHQIKIAVQYRATLNIFEKRSRLKV